MRSSTRVSSHQGQRIALRRVVALPLPTGGCAACCTHDRWPLHVVLMPGGRCMLFSCQVATIAFTPAQVGGTRTRSACASEAERACVGRRGESADRSHQERLVGRLGPDGLCKMILTRRALERECGGRTSVRSACRRRWHGMAPCGGGSSASTGSSCLREVARGA